MTSQLDALSVHSTVVADTGDLSAIARYRPQDATTNPSLMLQAAADPRHASMIDDVLVRTPRSADCLDELHVEFGCRILGMIPGRVSTEVDARLSFDAAATEARAQRLLERYAASGIHTDRVLIKIAGTWEGVRAAARLERQGVHCNLTLIFSLAQAVACADAGVTLVSPFVGRIHDWHLHAQGLTEIAREADPGVASVRRIYQYYKQFGYSTQVMGASFRKTTQILDLAGCDLLTISPGLLGELAARPGAVSRCLDPVSARAAGFDKLQLDEAGFRWQHNEDPMAVDLLANGIRRFAADTRELEKVIAARRGVA